jgi:hypothetical protein
MPYETAAFAHTLFMKSVICPNSGLPHCFILVDHWLKHCDLKLYGNGSVPIPFLKGKYKASLSNTVNSVRNPDKAK